MPDIAMSEITESIRQLVLKSGTAKPDGIRDLDTTQVVRDLLKEIDGICMKIEGLMMHPSQYSLANGMVHTKPAQHHSEEAVLRRRASDQGTMQPHYGRRTEPGENRSGEVARERNGG